MQASFTPPRVGRAAALLLGCAWLAPGPRPAAATLNGSIDHEGLTRTFVYHVPDSLPPSPVPLVFCLHGGGSTGAGTITLTLGRFNQLAERDKFIVIYPDGVANQWDDCRADAPTVTGDADDVGFVDALIGWFSTQYSIDPRRVYACGISNGALMTYRLGFELGSKLAAIAAVAGNLPANSQCSAPRNPISVLVMDGTADPLMPYGGGYVAGAPSRGIVQSVDFTVNFWIGFDHCASVPQIEDLADVNMIDDSTVTRLTYSGGVLGTEVILYRINGGGHTWPGGIQYLSVSSIGPVNRDVNGCDEIWDFFRRHTLVPLEAGPRTWNNYR